MLPNWRNAPEMVHNQMESAATLPARRPRRELRSARRLEARTGPSAPSPLSKHPHQFRT